MVNIVDARESTGTNVVANARLAAGLNQIIRCGSTDVLSKLVTANSRGLITGTSTGGVMDTAILQRAGLLLDLRSPSERHEGRAQRWMSSPVTHNSWQHISTDKYDNNYGINQAVATVVAYEVSPDKKYSEAELQRILDQNSPRVVVRLDILSPMRFMEYLEQNWWSTTEKHHADLLRKGTNMLERQRQEKLHTMRIQTLNSRGLLGLNEAILETGQQGLCTALQLITIFMERMAKEEEERRAKNQQYTSDSSQLHDLIVVHCVQGKDRTGLLVMLCQAIIGLSQEEIVHDYHRSHDILLKRRNRRTKQRIDSKQGVSSAAMQRVAATTQSHHHQTSTVAVTAAKWDPSIFLGAPEEIMKCTLELLNTRYGSVAPGYLDHIGFGAVWRKRFQQAQKTKPRHLGRAFAASSKL